MKRICLYGGGKNLGGTEIYLITLVRALKDDVVFDYLIRHDYGKIPFENEIISSRCDGIRTHEALSNRP